MGRGGESFAAPENLGRLSKGADRRIMGRKIIGKKPRKGVFPVQSEVFQDFLKD